MKFIYRFITIAALGLTAIAPSHSIWARSPSSAAEGPAFSTQIGRSASYLAMQYYSLPPWRVFENMISRDSRSWFGDRYVDESLSSVSVVDGSLSSGYWSARGYYYYLSGWNDQQYTGWIVFRYRNGNFDCVIYHNFPDTCRALRG